MGLHPSQTPTRRSQKERTSLPSPPAHAGGQGTEGRTGHYKRATNRRQTRGLHGHHNCDAQP
eukprot:5246829-Pyramimonas_sp.AAC.1